MLVLLLLPMLMLLLSLLLLHLLLAAIAIAIADVDATADVDTTATTIAIAAATAAGLLPLLQLLPAFALTRIKRGDSPNRDRAAPRGASSRLEDRIEESSEVELARLSAPHHHRL